MMYSFLTGLMFTACMFHSVFLYLWSSGTTCLPFCLKKQLKKKRHPRTKLYI